MEVQIPYSILFTFCFLLLIHKLLSNYKKFTKSLPPGPWKLPFIGNLHQLVGSLPHHAMRDLAIKHGPLMQLQLGELPLVVVSSPEIIKELLTTHDKIFSNRPTQLASHIVGYNCTTLSFSPYNNYWRQLRKVCTLELLSVKRVQSFRTIREEEISEIMKTISEHIGSSINLTGKLFMLTNNILSRAAFGKKQSADVESILETIKQLHESANWFSIADLYPSIKGLGVITGMKAKFEKFHQKIDKLFESIIKDHMEKKGTLSQNEEAKEKDDLVDVLLRIQKENELDIPLTLDNVKAVILDMFLGGIDTSATTIEWAMSELLRSPKIMKEAQAEVRKVCGGKGYVNETDIEQLKYLRAVIKETLRMHPPGPLIPRESYEPCKINGYLIPSKTRVIFNVWAMGRDTNYWNEPYKFEPQRFLNTSIDFKDSNFHYIPFGAGRRMCPGIAFASPIVELLLSNLLYHYDWMLPNGMKPHELEMNEAFGSITKRKGNLWVIPVSYISPMGRSLCQ